MEKKEGTKKVEHKGDFHTCDYCIQKFQCDDLKIDDDGFRCCNCLQLVVTDKIITRLAYWCSIECMDEDFPQYSSNDDVEDIFRWQDFEDVLYNDV